MLSSAFSLLFCVLSIFVCLFGYIFFLLKKIYQSISYIKTERIKRIFPDLYDVAWCRCFCIYLHHILKLASYSVDLVGLGPRTFTVLTLTLSLSLLHLLHSFSPVVTSYVKSLETASMKLGADNRIVKVQMIEKRENATRHSRSTTAAANFHSLQIASASSWSRNLWAMYDTSSKIRWISGGGRPTPIPRPTTPLLTCGSASSLGELWARPPSVTPESLEGGQCGLSIGW